MTACAKWVGSALAAGSFLLFSSSLTQTTAVAQTSTEDQTPAVQSGPSNPDSTADAAAPAMPAPGSAEEAAAVGRVSAVLQGLDKITARVSEFEAPIGETVRFGSFEIVVRACQKTPPEEPPESTAYLEITDVRPDEPPSVVFKGWMFASSPALSAVEHPVYDVWITNCREAQAVSSPAPDAAQTDPETTEEAAPAQ